METLPVSMAARHSRSKFTDYVELTKPRISAMVLVTVAIAAMVVSPSLEWWTLLHILIGVGLTAASGSAINQFIERYTDWLMPRTAQRPLPKQRLSATEVALFGSMTLGVGISYLWTLVGWPAAAMAGLTWVLYAVIYTPLKVVTHYNTYVGAVAGAMPVLIGVVGVHGSIPPLAWALFAILFVWQFPHFMAIAWKYRQEYAQGGLKMFSVTDPSGRSTAWHALIFALLIFPVSLTAIWLASGLNWIYMSLAFLLGISYLIPAFRFWRELNVERGRWLLIASLWYLPLMYLLVLLATAF